MLVVIPLAALPASRLTKKALRRTREGQAQLGELAAQLQEGLGGLRTIQAFNGQAAELARSRLTRSAHEKAVVSAAWARGAVPGLMEVLAAAALAGRWPTRRSRTPWSPRRCCRLVTAVDPRLPAGEGSGPGHPVRDAGGGRGRAHLRAAGPAPPGGGRAGGAARCRRCSEAMQAEGRARSPMGTAPGAGGLTPGAAGGQGHGAGGPERRRQEHGDVPAAALRDAPRGPAAARWSGRGLLPGGERAGAVRAGDAGAAALLRARVLDNLRFARPERDDGGGGGGGAGGERGRLHPGAAAGLRHADGRARA